MGFFSRIFGGGAKGSLSSLGKSYKLAARLPVATNTHRFTFALESPDAVLGLPVGHHLEVRLPGGGGVSRAYTPTTGDSTKGSFDLVVKIYTDGPVSTYLDSLQVGDTADIAGPHGEITYTGAGTFDIEDPFSGDKRSIPCKGVGMIAGGTGITPMYQIAAHSASLADDQLEMSLLFANRRPEDVMLREELDTLARACPRFRVGYSVDACQDSDDWVGHTGQVDTSMVSAALEALPNGRPELICICGPMGFNKAVKRILSEDLGFDKDTVFEF